MQKIIDTIDEGIRLGKEKARLNSNDLLSIAIELMAVARQRGDDELLHPSDDSKLWTARMQSAWEELYRVVECDAPGKIAEEQLNMRKWEIETFGKH